MTKSSSTTARLDCWAPLVLLACLGGCGSGPDVVATSREAGNTGAKASDEISGAALQTAEGGNGAPAPFLLISINGTVAPGETGAFCRLAPVERDLDVTRVIHFSAALPGTVRVMTSPLSAYGAKAAPGVLDCAKVGGERQEPFYVSAESAADSALESGSVHLAADSALLVEYDVTNPGKDAMHAEETVLLDVGSR
jgi:hypothetical protein